MAADEAIVPVFMPPLAATLVRAEHLKGAPLTESEVQRLRDRAPCIMMTQADADRITEGRGYRDVNPENYWADWHRLRVQMTGHGDLPQLVFCVPGGDDLVETAGPILEAEGIEHEFRPREKHLEKAFEASEFRSEPSLEPEDWDLIRAHTKVLYVMSRPLPASEGPGACDTFLRLGRRLLEAGGVAIKCDSSGIAHSRRRWIELDENASRHIDAPPGDDQAMWEFWYALFCAYVQFPIGDDDDWYTCGMHLLGQPDTILSTRLFREAGLSSDTAIELLRAFGVYLLAECPEGGFGTGHTFRTDAQSPRFRLTWEKCDRYKEDDFFFNPFGRWRFAEIVD
jgi:hypothetical protein